MEVAQTVLIVLHAVYEIRQGLKDNQAEAIRLCDRCAALKVPVAALIAEGVAKVEEKEDILRRLSDILFECTEHVSNNEKTAWRFFTKVTFRQNYGDEIFSLHTRLDPCFLDLLGVLVDKDQRRREFLEDSRRSFDASVQYFIANVHELSPQGKSSADELRELKDNVDSNEKVLEDMLVKRGFKPLSDTEVDVILAEQIYLLKLTSSKLDQVVQKLDHVLVLVGQKQLTEDQFIVRKEILKKLELPHSEVQKLGVPLAQGAYGEVYLGMLRKNHPVVIKNIKNKNDEPLTKEQQWMAESEILVMNYLTDVSVSFVSGYVPDAKEFMMVLELAPYGSLWSLIKNTTYFPTIPFSLSVVWLCDIIDALKHIHGKAVAHKNIKCENVLVYHGLKVKVCDFGLAKHDTIDINLKSVVGCGALCFISPEVIEKRKSSVFSDVYSFAVTAVQLLTRHPPREDVSMTEQIRNAVQQCDLNDKLRVSVTALLVKCAKTNPASRPTSLSVFNDLGKFVDPIHGDPRLPIYRGRDLGLFKEIKRNADLLELEMWAEAGIGSVASPKSAISAISQSEKNQLVIDLIDPKVGTVASWLQQLVPDIEESDALQYAQFLVAQKTSTVERCRKEISNRGSVWLQRLGIAEVDADDISAAVNELTPSPALPFMESTSEKVR